MRKRILRDYVLVVTAALLCGFLIFYLVVSNIMMESTRRDLEYVLQTIRSIPVENLVEQKDDLSDSLRGDDSRLTIIDEDGTVLLDSDVRGDMENHLEREEVQMALSSADGMGYAVRDSTTMNMRMMYVALYSKEQHAVYRMAIPYQGLDSYAMTLLPVAAISFAVALLIAIILSRKSARSVTRPLREIGRTIRESQKEGTTLKFRTFEYDELNEIASTIEQMENEINHYLKKLKSEKKIRQEFFDNASHELKTPLTSIRGYGELLRSGVVNDPKQAQECVDRILKETTHMTALITDILMISRLEGNDVVEKKTDIALRPAVEELCKSFTPMANEHRVMLEMQCETLCVHMSQKHVEQLIGNLISNAIKYMDKPKGIIQIRVKDVGDFIQVEIEDNGKGIAAKDIAYIFDRFYRTDVSRNSSKGGSGIGLSIVKKILEDHGGKVWATSRLGIGTIMYFVLRKYQEVPMK